MESLDTLVIGAGVVGLACARALALQGREVVVLEATDAIGSGTSARNSEVIHAGLYYEPESWKAWLCVEGRQRLYTYAAERGIPPRTIERVLADFAGVFDADGANAAAGAQELEMMIALIWQGTDENGQPQIYKLYEAKEKVGTFAQASLLRGIIPRRVQEGVGSVFRKYSGAFRKAQREIGQ